MKTLFVVLAIMVVIVFIASYVMYLIFKDDQDV